MSIALSMVAVFAGVDWVKCGRKCLEGFRNGEKKVGVWLSVFTKSSLELAAAAQKKVSRPPDNTWLTAGRDGMG